MKAYMYETMYILRPDMNDEAVDSTIGKYQGSIERAGSHHSRNPAPG
jgi:small subunit ribosomal protein S6